MKKAKKLFNELSMVSRPVRSKMTIIYAIMSLIPLLVCVYLASNFIFPHVEQAGLIVVFILLVIIFFLSAFGYRLIKNVIEPVLQITVDAKEIAKGDFERSIEVHREDEIGLLSDSLNVITQQIRDNIDELENYRERTKEINLQINKMVAALSGLLRIGGLISTKTGLKEVMDAIADTLSEVEAKSPTAILVVDKGKNSLEVFSLANFKDQKAAKEPVTLGQGLVGKVATEAKPVIVDKNTEALPEAESFRQTYGVENGVIIPVILMGKCWAVLLMGNSKRDYQYSNDQIDLYNVFAKQIAVALEHDILTKKAEDLTVVDELTKLYNSNYIHKRLEEEVGRALVYQRPCSFILYKIGDFEGYCKKYGRMTGEEALKRIAKIISESLSPVDRAARFNDDEFAIILPERNKREAAQVADSLKSEFSRLKIEGAPELREVTVSGGVSENPIDGSTAVELIDKARERLKNAVGSGGNTIIS